MCYVINCLSACCEVVVRLLLCLGKRLGKHNERISTVLGLLKMCLSIIFSASCCKVNCNIGSFHPIGNFQEKSGIKPPLNPNRGRNPNPRKGVGYFGGYIARAYIFSFSEKFLLQNFGIERIEMQLFLFDRLVPEQFQ